MRGGRALSVAVVVVICSGCSTAATSVAPRETGTAPSPTALRTTGTVTPPVLACKEATGGARCPSPIASPSVSTVPALEVSNVAFSDALDGLAVGTECVESTQACAVVVDSTVDGGRTWGPPIEVGRFSEDTFGSAYTVGLHVRFRGHEVWVSGPGIFESHDGGRTWVHDFGAPVVALEPAATTVWAVGGCSTSTPAASCALYTSHVGSDVWTRADVQPAFSGGSGGAAWAPVLERAPGGVAFVSSGSPRGSGQPGMFVTRDNGRTWGSAPAPCTSIVSLRSPDGTRVWALCGGGGGAGSGPKAVYVSNDGARSWQLRADNTVSPPVGVISAGGYARSLAVTGSAVALISSSRAGIIRTTDGGRTWADVGSSGVCLADGNGVGELWFISSTIGWALEENDDGGPQCPLLVRTTDGGVSWTRVASPLGWTAS